MSTKEEIEKMIKEMFDELTTNEQMFRKVPNERLAKVTATLFSLAIRLACLSDKGMWASKDILREASDLARAYNNDQPLKIIP